MERNFHKIFISCLTLLLLINGCSLNAQTLQGASKNHSTPLLTTSNTYEDLDSVTFPDMLGAKAVMVIANFEMQVDPGVNGNLTGKYQITDRTSTSAEITRFVVGKKVVDKGLGTAVHIFTFPSFTGSKSFILRHTRVESGPRNISSRANLVAIVLDDSTASLPFDVISTGDVTTQNTSFEPIAGTTTGPIVLPFTSGIYLTAAFSTLGDADLTGSWEIQSSTDGSSFTTVPNASISRSNSKDVGAASITALLENQPAGTYHFRVAHKTSTVGTTLTTRNMTLVAIGLSEANGNVYPTFKSTGGSAITSSVSPSVAASTGNITSVYGSNSLFAHAVFNMSSTAEIAYPGFSLSISNATFSPITLNRYMPDPSGGTGTGGLVGLATGLTKGSAHQVSLNHYSDGNNTLTTSNINIVGFQLTSNPLIWGGSTDGEWHTETNWIPNSVPDEHSNVSLTSGSTIIGASGNASCNDLEISGGALTIQSDASNSGSLIIGGSSAGNITYNRYLTGAVWHLVAAPVESQSVWSYATTGSNSIAEKTGKRAITTFNEGIDTWDPYPTVDPSQNFISGTGYSTLRTTDGTVSFTGTANTGDLSAIPITRNFHGWNLIGNPYPSSINATTTADPENTLLSAVNISNLDPSYAALYLWQSSTGTYQIINNSGGTPTGTLSQDYIQAGQGFFVRALDNSSRTFSIAKAIQAHQPGTSMLKSAAVPWPGIQLYAESGDHESSTFITFNEKMTKGLDVTFDAGMNKSNPQFALYTRLVEDNEVDFAIQCLPTNISELVIPVGLDAQSGQTVTIRAEMSNWPANSKVFLEVRNKGEFIKLDREGAYYTFTTDSDNTGIGNFFLHTIFEATGMEEIETAPDPLTVITNQNAGYIRLIGMLDEGSNALLYDLSGRKRMQVTLMNSYENTLPVADLECGIYILQVQNKRQVIGKKIMW